jgi:hypothetical protein
MTMDDKNNSGYSNSGNRNSGDWNSGNRNSGNSNSGDWNSGDSNSGYSNSGHWNSGNRNSGDWNSGDWNSGIFNTDEPKMRSFNKPCKMTMSEFLESDLYIVFDVRLTEWIDNQLVVYGYKEAWSKWWEANKSPEMVERIKKLPNFDVAIFEEITGIVIDKPENMVELSNGAKVSESTIQEALKFMAEYGVT